MKTDTSLSFQNLLTEALIPHFCTGNGGGFQPSGFDPRSVRLSETDMADFIRAWNGQLVTHIGAGKYRAARSGASEQFFWSGSKKASPRTFTLWIEPVITLGFLARLHFDLGWPREYIGTQSAGDWAFDVIVTKNPDTMDEYIACEVKKSRKEIDALAEYMKHFAWNPHELHDEKNASKNAFKKVAALRKRKPPFLWLVGPDRYEQAFRVGYEDGGRITMASMPLEALSYQHFEMGRT
ncbi:hypothetical protein [Brucella haematophila]|uniref:hypothetical protein n=1 Tax=Brucella haematophila TaxID=419474 RepID=UPI00110D9597|nr:hypothetical protein [Brucella haematophila]TMV03142.1 hypothetical protein FGI60_12055 [Brucella haematophila]